MVVNTDYTGNILVSGSVSVSNGTYLTETESIGVVLSTSVNAQGNGSALERLTRYYTTHLYVPGYPAYTTSGINSQNDTVLSITNDTFTVVDTREDAAGNFAVGLTLMGTIAPGGATVTARYFTNFYTIVAGYGFSGNLYGTGVLNREVFPIQLYADGPASTQITDLNTEQVFSFVGINDGNGNGDTATVTLSNPANGTLSSAVGGSFNAATGVFTVAGDEGYIENVLDSLTFTPTFHQVATGGTVVTDLLLTVSDISGATVTATSSIVTTAAVGPLLLSDEVIGPIEASDRMGPVPIGTGQLFDPDPGAEITVQITVSNPANGTLSDLGFGSYDAVTGIFSVEGTLAAVNQALADLTFTPTQGQVAAGNVLTTDFMLSIDDSFGASSDDAVAVAVVSGGRYQTLTYAVGNDAEEGAAYLDEGILFGAGGNIIGVGGNDGGAPDIFELINSGSVFSPTAVDLAPFGAETVIGGDLIADSAGDIFGVMWGSGTNSYTEIFEIPRTAGGYGPLTQIAATDEGVPGNIVMDNSGDIFSIGANGVFEIKDAAGAGLHTAVAIDPQTILTNLYTNSIAIDSSGDLFFVASTSKSDSGTNEIAELTFANGTYAATPAILYAPSVEGNFYPLSVYVGPGGNLFLLGSSSVAELVKTGGTFATAPIGIGGTFSPNPLASAPLTFDAAGDIFGVAASSVFEIVNTPTGYSNATILLSGAPGQTPLPQLAIDSQGDIFGETASGQVYELREVAATSAGTEPFSPPTISGTGSGGTVVAGGAFPLFHSVAITDPNLGQTETVTVTVSTPNDGTWASLGGGTYSASTGIYTVIGNASMVTAALDALIFDPSIGGQIAFSIDVTDTAGQTAISNTTTIMATSGPLIVNVPGGSYAYSDYPIATASKAIGQYSGSNGTGTLQSYIVDNTDGSSYLFTYNLTPTATQTTQHWSGFESSDGAPTGPLLADVVNNADGTTLVYAYNPTSTVTQTAELWSATNVDGSAAGSPISDVVNNTDGTTLVYAYNPTAGVTQTTTEWSATNPDGSAAGAKQWAVIDNSDGTAIMYVYNPASDETQTVTFYPGCNPANGAVTGNPTSEVIDYTAGLYAYQSAEIAYNASGVATGTTYYAGSDATGAVVSGPTSALPPVDAADSGVISISGTGQAVDPGFGSDGIQFLSGASDDTLVLHTDGSDTVSGFDPSAGDLLNLRSLFSEAGINLASAVADLSAYINVSVVGSDAAVLFDPTGQGGGSAVATLTDGASLVPELKAGSGLLV